MQNLNFWMIMCPIHFIARSLIDRITICMYSQLEYCCKTRSKIIANDLNKRKIIRPTYNISLHDNSCVKIVIYVVAL